MGYKGYVKGDVVILEERLAVPDGTQVEIFIPPAKAGRVKGEGSQVSPRQRSASFLPIPLWFTLSSKKMCMKLEDLPAGARVFVDANILIYHFSGISLECRAFLRVYQPVDIP